jgi:DNA-binding NarL/FixJ family response regulator
MLSSSFCARARSSSSVLSSVCRTQHAGVLMWCGAWSDAEAELELAIRHLAGARPAMQEQPLVRLAELRRRQGRFEEAEALLGRVDWHPDGQLVRAAMALDRGKAESAADHARRFLEQAPPSNKTDRAFGGELLLRAELALGRTPDARTLEDIQALAAGVGTDPLRASVRIAEGLIATASDKHEHARAAFEDAIGLLARAGSRYETARARVDLAGSLLALHRADAARAELDRAGRAFEELGAAWEARRARALLDESFGEHPAAPERARPGRLSARELEVLRLMAEGLSNPQIAKQLIVSEFTVKRHVANILTKLDLPTRAAAAAYAAREGWV